MLMLRFNAIYMRSVSTFEDFCQWVANLKDSESLKLFPFCFIFIVFNLTVRKSQNPTENPRQYIIKGVN